MSTIKIKDIPYKRYEKESMEKAFARFFEENANAKCANDVMEARARLLKEMDILGTELSVAYFRYTINTRDEFYLQEQEYYDEVMPIYGGLMSKYADAMLNSPFRTELEKLLPETCFLNYECAKRANDERIIEERQEENSIVTEYSQLMSCITTDWRGEQKTISFIRGFMEDEDRNVRREAALAVDRALAANADKLDDIYDRLVKVRDRMAKKLGYDNFIQLGYYRMSRIDYNREMVERFRENVVEDLVPIVYSLKNDVKDRLGLDTFRFYDNDVYPVGVPRPYVNGEELLLAAKDMYNEMSPVTGAFMEKMLEAEAFDVVARDGKWGGGYCTNLPLYNQPIILANFNGSSGDVDVVTHEYGHALAMNFVKDYGDSEADIGSSETAETHSMSMEFFAWKYIDKFFKNVNAYKYKHLAAALSFIPYGCIVDEFQHIVYEHPELTPAERNEAYLALEKKYRPYLSYEDLPYLSKGTRWQYQMHIYESPFYYIDYCLAQVISLEFLSESQKDYDDALNRYFEHAKRGGQYAFNKLVLLAGLKSPFELGALKEVAETSIKIIEELK